MIPFKASSGLTSKIARLFSNGEQGCWYDPSDFSTLYQDSAGTTPVTAVEQPVGLMLDKSKGVVPGIELITDVANRDFTSDTGFWAKQGAVTIGGGSANFSSSTDNSAIYRFNFLVIGRYYEFTFTITSISSGAVGVWNYAPQYTAPGTYTVKLLANTATVGFKSFGSSTTASIDNVSVKEVTGNHAFQTTSISRPTLSARVNLLTNTEDFNAAAWTKHSTTIGAGNYSDALGTTKAQRIVETATTAQHAVYYSRTGVFETLNYSIYLKAGERYLARVCFTDNTSESKGVLVNLNDGSFTVESAGTVYTSISGNVVRNAATGWCYITVTATRSSATSPSSNNYFLFQMRDDAGNLSYAGDISKGIYACFPDLRVANDGVNLPPYQRVGNVSVTPSDYDTVGFPLYLKFDGIDDFLVTNSINFTATDKMTVWAGVRKFREADEIICELGTYYTDFGGFYFNNYATAKFVYGGRGKRIGISNDDALWAVSAPTTVVMTAQQGINSGLPSTLRGNGVLRGSSISTTFGGGNFGNYPLYIGRRGGTSLPFNGRIYSLIVRGALSSDSEITNAENWVELKTFGKDMVTVYSDPVTTALGEQIITADGQDIFMTATYQ